MLHRLIVAAIAGSPGVFAACLEGRCSSDGGLVVRSRQPLVDGARRLLELGFDSAAALTLRHEALPYDSFRPLPIGRLAGWTYEERDHGGLRQVPWKPDPRYGVAPGNRIAGSDGVRVPAAAESLQRVWQPILEPTSRRDAP